jgi:DNA polymerase III subunit epsilon
MMLKLTRPFVGIDLETTGTNVEQDRIVQISLHQMLPTGEDRWYTQLLNPEVPIPADATAINHITDEMVASMPKFRELAKFFYDIVDGADYFGYNCIQFDLPLLSSQFAECGYRLSWEDRFVVDSQRIFFKYEPRTLEGAVQFYCGRLHRNPHDSLSDIAETQCVIDEQIKRYSLPDTVEGLCQEMKPDYYIDYEGKLQLNAEGDVVMKFGKYNGYRVRDVLISDKSYVNWMLDASFSNTVKRALVQVISDLEDMHAISK